MSRSQIYYSDRYSDDQYEYRWAAVVSSSPFTVSDIKQTKSLLLSEHPVNKHVKKNVLLKMSFLNSLVSLRTRMLFLGFKLK